MPQIFRIVVLSDTHMHHDKLVVEDLPAADVLVHCGDFTAYGRATHALSFLAWIKALPVDMYTHKIMVLGNHELPLRHEWGIERIRAECAAVGVVLLENESVTIDVGADTPLVIHGAPFVPEHGAGAHSVSAKARADVLVTHNPPAGCLDGGTGAATVRKFIVQHQPVLALFGHVHSQRGAVHASAVCRTTFVNAAMCGSGRHERTLVHGAVLCTLERVRDSHATGWSCSSVKMIDRPSTESSAKQD